MNPPSGPRSAREQVPFGVRVAGAWSGYLLLIAVTVLAFLWVVTRLGLMTVSLVTGIMIAALFQPLVRWLMRHGFRRGLAATVAFLVGVVSVGGLLWFVVAQILSSQDEFARQLSTAEYSARDWLISGPLGVDPGTASEYTVDLGQTLSDHSAAILAEASTHLGTVLGLLSGVVLTLFCVLFLLADDGSVYRWCVKLLPRRAQVYAEVGGTAAWRTLVVYMRSLVLLAAINALAMLPIMWIADVPLAVPLTVLLFLGSLIPLVGVILAGVVVFVIALIGKGVVTAIVMMVALMMVVQLFGNLLNPIILGKFVNLHPLAILLGVTGGSIIGGAFGAFVAVPLIAVLNNMIKVMRSHRLDELSAEGVDDLPDDESERLAKELL